MLIDTFPSFLQYWNAYRDHPLGEQIEAWVAGYMSHWPDLLAMQVDDYTAQDVDWQTIAREKVFPLLGARLPAIVEAHGHLVVRCGPVVARARQVLHLDLDPIYVLYVGIGCGAGWVTSFRGQPAILFGLENIAECGWSDVETIDGLIAHETGHLVHQHWRTSHNRPAGSGPWWQLYEEGFAQHVEHLILDTKAGHQAGGGEGWLAWCEAHRGWLAAEFLRAVDHGEPVSRFFGSWFDIEGYSETGYYLGCEVIRALEQDHSLLDIALLDESTNAYASSQTNAYASSQTNACASSCQATVRPILERMAAGEA